jgi:hypothetical protein
MCMQCKGMCESCKAKYIETRLRRCASLFANLGTDSSESEREEAYAKEKLLLQQIMQVDLEKGKRLLNLD